MSSGTAIPPPPPAETPAQRRSAQTDGFIEQQLRRTRRQVKGVDVASELITLAIGGLGYLLAAALLDHWLIPGGLGFWGRLLLMAGLVGGAGYYCAVRLLPLLIYRINPLFAARTIEESRPSLKNSLINFLLLRRNRGELPEVVYSALQHRAASDLAEVPVDSVVDRSHVVRLWYVLAGVLAAYCLYLLVSPKNPLASAGRVIWPWAEISAPTRVTITGVRPGDEEDPAVVSRGDAIAVSAEVRGLHSGEEVTFCYTTADGQSVNEAIPMTLSGGQGSYRYDLPQDSFVAQQDVEYYLSAGDCTTRRYKIEVQIAPSIAVDSVAYDYPAYTRIPDAVIEGQGDIRAVEGTRVTVRATANLQIDKAEVDLDCDGRGGLSMHVDGRSATRQFTLRMREDDPSLSQHDSYQLRFTDTKRRRNRRPVRYRIQVIPDLEPRVELAVESHNPLPDEIQLPEGGTLEFRVRAEDPDFGLRRVALRAVCQGRSLPIRPMLELGRTSPGTAPHQGPLEAGYRFDSARLNLKAGDVVSYWAEAEDNKEPEANHAETDRRRIIIVPASSRQQPQPREGAQQPDQGETQPKPGSERPQPKPRDQQPGEENADPQENPAEKQPEDGQDPKQAQPKDEGPSEKDPSQQQGDAGQQGEGQPQPGEAGQKQEGAGEGQEGQPAEEPRRVEPGSNPGGAFQEILEHQQKQDQQKGQQAKPEQKPQQSPGQKQPEQQPNGGEGTQQQQPKQPGGQAEAKPQAEKSQAEKPQAGDQAGGQPKPGEKQPGGQAETKPQAEKPNPGGQAEAKPQAEQSQAEKPQPGGQAEAKPQAEQPQAEKPKPGGQAEAKPQAEKPQPGAEGSDTQQKPQPGEGAQSKGAGEPEKPQQETGQPSGKPSEKSSGGDTQDTKGQPGAGKPSAESSGTPSPQGKKQPRDKKAGDPSQGEGKQEEGKSPSISPKDSDSKGETAGDHSGGGQEGGGQRAKQPGAGAAGSQTEADQGTNAGMQKGQGETGTDAGDQVESERPTGKTATKQDGSGSDSRQKPGTGQGQKPQQQDRSDPSGAEKAPSDQPGGGQPQGESKDRPNAHRAGNPTTGGQPGQRPDLPVPPPPQKLTGDDPNLQYARKATDMALEHLRDQMTQEDSELLGRMKWTREDAESFHRFWQELKRQAAEEGSEADAARKQLDEALRNLGLRPRGAELGGGRIKADQLHRLREARDFRPPPEWAEQFRAFKMGISEQKDGQQDR